MIEGAVMWTSLETAELMALWRRTDTQQQFRSSGRNLAIWERLAEELLERGFYRTAHQCRAKLHNMVCVYRKVERGGLPRSRCRHFETLRGVLNATSKEDLQRFNAPWEERCRRERLLREQEQSQLSRLPAERCCDRPASNGQGNPSPGVQSSPAPHQLGLSSQVGLSLSQTRLSPSQIRLSPEQTQLSPEQGQPSPTRPLSEEAQLSPDTPGARAASSPLGSAARRPPPTLVRLPAKKRGRRRLPELLPLSGLPSGRVLPRHADSPGGGSGGGQTAGALQPSSGDDNNSVLQSKLTAYVQQGNGVMSSAVKRKTEDDAPSTNKVSGSAFVRVVPESLLRSRLASVGTDNEKRYSFWQGCAEGAKEQWLPSALDYTRDGASNLSTSHSDLSVSAYPESSADSTVTSADSVPSVPQESDYVSAVREDDRNRGGASVAWPAARSPVEVEDMPLALVVARPPPSPPGGLIICSPRPRSPPSPHRLIIDSDPETTSSPPSPPAPAAAAAAGAGVEWTLPRPGSFSPGGADPAVCTSRLWDLPVAAARCGTPPPAHRQSAAGRRHRSRASASPPPPRAIEAQYPVSTLSGLVELQHRRLLGLRGPPSLLKPRSRVGRPSAWQPGSEAQSAATWRRVQQLLSDMAGAQMAAYPLLAAPVRAGEGAV